MRTTEYSWKTIMLKMGGIINYHRVLLKRYKEGAWCRILLTAETFPPDEMQVIRRGEISAVMEKLLLHVYCYFLQELPCFIIDNLLFLLFFSILLVIVCFSRPFARSWQEELLTSHWIMKLWSGYANFLHKFLDSYWYICTIMFV